MTFLKKAIFNAEGAEDAEDWTGMLLGGWLLGFGGLGGRVEPLEDLVEQAVDEGWGLVGAVVLGEFDGFVDDDLGRRAPAGHFVVSEAKEGPVYRGEAVSGPLGGESEELGIGVFAAIVGAGDEGADVFECHWAKSLNSSQRVLYEGVESRGFWLGDGRVDLVQQLERKAAEGRAVNAITLLGRERLQNLWIRRGLIGALGAGEDIDGVEGEGKKFVWGH
jgi:hypothetical protein